MEASYKRGQPPPKFIADAPALLPGLSLYIEAFRELSTCRPYIGMKGTPGPIPWTAIQAYSMDLECNNEEADYMNKMVRALDDTYLEFMMQPTDKETSGRS